MTQLSPTALEEAATKLDPDAFAVDEFGCYALVSAASRRASARIHATAAITAYLAQAEKEGWVMVRGAEVDGLRSALKGLSDMYAWTWDKVDGGLMMSSSGVERFEKAHQRAYEVLYPDRPLISEDDDEAAQNGGEPCK